MGNLHKAYEAFGRQPVLIKKLLESGMMEGDIPVFVETCQNGKWNSSAIIEFFLDTLELKDDDPDAGFFAKMADKVASTFSGSKFSRQFTILSHPDLGRVLATHEAVKDIFPLCRPEGAIELKVQISWEFRSKKPDERVEKVVTDSDLVQKVVDAADFSGIVDSLAEAIAKEYNKNGPDKLQKLVQKVLEKKTDEAIAASQAEFYRVLGITKKAVVWQDTKTIISATWKGLNAAVTAVTIGATVAVGGPMGAAAAITYYAVNGLAVLKGFSDAYNDLKNRFGDIAKNINSCAKDLKAVQAQWESNGNIKEAGKAVVEQFCPAGLVKTSSNILNKLSGASEACDKMELTARELSPKLTEAMSQFESAYYTAQMLKEDLKGSTDPSLADAYSVIDTMKSALESLFNNIADINKEVLGYRKTIKKYTEAVELLNSRQSNWVKAWKVALEVGGTVLGYHAGNNLATVPDGTVWTNANNVCGNIGNYQLYVDSIKSAGERIKSSVEQGTFLPT